MKRRHLRADKFRRGDFEIVACSPTFKGLFRKVCVLFAEDTVMEKKQKTSEMQFVCYSLFAILAHFGAVAELINRLKTDDHKNETEQAV